MLSVSLIAARCAAGANRPEAWIHGAPRPNPDDRLLPPAIPAARGRIPVWRRVTRGQRVFPETKQTAGAKDDMGHLVREKLTPREMQVVGLIVQGCRNKDIANQLGTKEQVVKNYLRSVYGKVGVSDRLELALFAIHHHVVEGVAAT